MILVAVRREAGPSKYDLFAKPLLYIVYFAHTLYTRTRFGKGEGKILADSATLFSFLAMHILSFYFFHFLQVSRISSVFFSKFQAFYIFGFGFGFSSSRDR